MKLLIANPTVAVLLSTFNGERFLAEQLDSLVRQTHRSFVVLIRDDGSTDNTPMIVDSYLEKYPELIFRVRDDRGNLGAANSFLALLNAVDGQFYVMFCDQDDIWFPEKIDKFLLSIQRIESLQSTGVPVLVFGDMIVTDEFLSEISNSFWSFQRIQVDYCKDWRKILVSNCVTGCSSIINLYGVNLLKEFGSSPVLHDLLAGVLIAKSGVVEPMRTPTMYYRQHAVNIEGAKRFGFRYIFLRMHKFILVSAPKYFIFCRMVSLSPLIAIWLKSSSVLSRLLLSRSK